MTSDLRLAGLLLSLLAGCGFFGGDQADPGEDDALPTELVAEPSGEGDGDGRGSSEDGDPPARIAGVDVSALEADQREEFEDALGDALSPCGQPFTLRVCLDEERDCRLCAPAASYAARLAGFGVSASKIRDGLRLRYDDDQRRELTTEGSPARGDEAAPITIVEFSDFQCPHCALAHEPLREVIERHPGRVRVVFKHFPLSFHTHAELAARAAVAAQMQGKFWEMHDLLFQNQADLSPELIERLANQIGLDMRRFRADRDSDEVGRRVAADRALGEEAGVQGTPALFINGRDYPLGIEDIDAYLVEEEAALR